MIRPAAVSDIPALLEMGGKFSEAARLIEHVGYDPASMAKTFVYMIEDENCAVFIAQNGAIGGMKSPHPFNHAHWIAQELFWWSEGREGLRLLDAFEAQAAAEAAQTAAETAQAAADAAQDAVDALPVGSRVVTATGNINDNDSDILADASGGAITLSLPAAALVNHQIRVTKTDASGNAVTVDADGTETINGNPNVGLTVQYQTTLLSSDGTDAWYAI